MNTHLIQWTLNGISQPVEHFTSPTDMREIVGKIDKLPVLSGTATRIMELAADPFADAQQLADIIELDPILTAQVIRWANSPLYAQQSAITSVQQAIHRVLGFQYVLNAALSLTALKPLQSPKQGALGAKNLWIQALMSVQLMQGLSKKIPLEIRPNLREIFLVALIHNIGFLLLAHYFPAEFSYLNKVAEKNPNLVIYDAERFAFNIDHGLLGTWLMRTWNMPGAVIEVIYHHHNPNYQGDHYHLNQLTFLNDCLLGQIGVGDGQNQTCPDEIYTSLQLSPGDCAAILEKIAERTEDISATAEMLCS